MEHLDWFSPTGLDHCILLGIGAGSSAPFGVGGFLLRLGIGSIPTAIVGAIGGVLGVMAAD